MYTYDFDNSSIAVGIVDKCEILIHIYIADICVIPEVVLRTLYSIYHRFVPNFVLLQSIFLLFQKLTDTVF